MRNFRQLPFPLPPLAEQKRITEKVAELMKPLNQLEETCATRETIRNQLTTTSFTQFSSLSITPKTFSSRSNFILDNLSNLTARPGQIKQLRQAILNLAVQGKLVKQDSTDEPAQNFLRKLPLSIKNAYEANANPSQKDKADTPFPCPSGWVWAQVQQLADPNRHIAFGVHRFGKEPKFGGVSTLRSSDVRSGYIDLSGIRSVDREIEAKYARTRLKGGEVVINVRGTLGGVALVPESLKGFNISREVAVIPIVEELSGPFMVYLMLSPFFWNHIQTNLRGIAYKGLNIGTLRKLCVPLPPLAEQHRIAAKIDTLMTLCDKLESSLITIDTTRSRILEVLFHEAFNLTTTHEKHIT